MALRGRTITRNTTTRGSSPVTYLYKILYEGNSIYKCVRPLASRGGTSVEASSGASAVRNFGRTNAVLYKPRALSAYWSRFQRGQVGAGRLQRPHDRRNNCPAPDPTNVYPRPLPQHAHGGVVELRTGVLVERGPAGVEPRSEHCARRGQAIY